jgi:hypothetical protein
MNVEDAKPPFEVVEETLQQKSTKLLFKKTNI